MHIYISSTPIQTGNTNLPLRDCYKYRVLCLLPSQVLGTAPLTQRKGALKMDYNKRLAKLDEHLAKHPTDYQAKIARLKTFSNAVEHEQYLKKVERLKRVAEYRRIIDGSK